MSLSDRSDLQLRTRLSELGFELSCCSVADESRIKRIYDDRDEIVAELDRRAEAELYWTCIECGNRFHNESINDAPYGPKITTDPKTGWMTIAGHICQSCGDAAERNQPAPGWTA